MHRVSMVPGAFGPEGANSGVKEGASQELRSGQKSEGWPLRGLGSISHLACLGNAGRGVCGGQNGREPSESSKPGITQGLGEHRKNNADDILKHNYPARPPQPQPAVIMLTDSEQSTNAGAVAFT